MGNLKNLEITTVTSLNEFKDTRTKTRQSRDSFLNVRVNTDVTHDNKHSSKIRTDDVTLVLKVRQSISLAFSGNALVPKTFFSSSGFRVSVEHQ